MPKLLLICLALAIGGSSPVPEHGAGSPPSVPAAAAPVGRAKVRVGLDPTIRWSGSAVDGQERVDETVARFRDAGLRLPDLEVVFHDSDAPCKGHDGLFQSQFRPWRLLVCTDAEFVLTHELAHAWELANLGDDDRERYLAHRGLDSWSSADADWRDRGVEDAAFMLQQNLMLRPARIDTERWRERIAAYEELTGMVSPVVAHGSV